MTCALSICDWVESVHFIRLRMYTDWKLFAKGSAKRCILSESQKPYSAWDSDTLRSIPSVITPILCGVVTTHSVNGSPIPRDPGLRTSPKIGDARFRSVLGAYGMHGALGAGQRRRRSRAMGAFLRAAVQAFGCWTRCSVTPAGRKVARIAFRPQGRVPELARCAGLRRVPAAGGLPGPRRGAPRGLLRALAVQRRCAPGGAAVQQRREPPGAAAPCAGAAAGAPTGAGRELWAEAVAPTGGGVGADARGASQYLTFVLQADGFLYRMCRALVGTLLEVTVACRHACSRQASMRLGCCCLSAPRWIIPHYARARGDPCGGGQGEALARRRARHFAEWATTGGWRLRGAAWAHHGQCHL